MYLPEGPLPLLMIVALVILIVIQKFISIGVAVLGLLAGDGSGVAGGFATARFHMAVLAGLSWRADWARMTLIWKGDTKYLASPYH